MLEYVQLVASNLVAQNYGSCNDVFSPGVAEILTDEANVRDVEVIQAAILHDTVEDTDTSFDEIEAEFGVNVCQLVKEVTDDKSLPKAERKRLQVTCLPYSLMLLI
jgi:Guanosine polyphosphate pyrophosphohydrolases/synthetases